MKNSKSKAIFVLALASTFGSQAAAQTTFSHDNTIAITAVGGGEDLLTEGAPGPPVVAIGGAVLGLVAGAHIDALSFGDDTPLMSEHPIVFSLDANSIGPGFVGNDVSLEFHADSAPCVGSAPVANAPCGDLSARAPRGRDSGSPAGAVPRRPTAKSAWKTPTSTPSPSPPCIKSKSRRRLGCCWRS